MAYKFDDYLKPCSRYRRNYHRRFRFQVKDAFDRISNIFEKGLTIETGFFVCIVLVVILGNIVYFAHVLQHL